MSDTTQSTLIGFVADLMFEEQIARVAGHLGFATRFIADASEFGDEEVRDRPGEPIHGRTATMTDRLSAWQPALVLIDLNNDAVPWERWIPIIKSSPATRRIPVLAFGSHVEVDTLKRASAVGADEVVSRGRFTSAMPDLIEKMARTSDEALLDEPCRQPLHPDAVHGIELFNAGRYYDAHHGLEDAWMADKGPGRDLYRSILQVAVAYLQIERGNYRGAVKMFMRVRQWLLPLPDVCRGVDVAQLRADAEAAYAALQALGQDRVGEFDMAMLKPVVLVSAETE